jgi:hypothetical protein
VPTKCQTVFGRRFALADAVAVIPRPLLSHLCRPENAGRSIAADQAVWARSEGLERPTPTDAHRHSVREAGGLAVQMPGRPAALLAEIGHLGERTARDRA